MWCYVFGMSAYYLAHAVRISKTWFVTQSYVHTHMNSPMQSDVWHVRMYTSACVTLCMAACSFACSEFAVCACERKNERERESEREWISQRADVKVFFSLSTLYQKVQGIEWTWATLRVFAQNYCERGSTQIRRGVKGRLTGKFQRSQTTSTEPVPIHASKMNMKSQK